MKRRRWKIFKWVGLWACVALVLLFAASRWWVAVLYTKGHVISIVEPGAFIFLYYGEWGLPVEWHVIPRETAPFLWMFEVTGRPFTQDWGVVIPLWIPFVLIGFPTIVAWRRDARIPLGHCKKCGYDLTGNVSGVCPECGTEWERG